MGTYVPDNTIKKIRGLFTLNSGELPMGGSGYEAHAITKKGIQKNS